MFRSKIKIVHFRKEGNLNEKKGVIHYVNSCYDAFHGKCLFGISGGISSE